MFTMFAMFLYFALLIDLAVVSTKVSAYVLVCIRMLSEVGLFLMGVGAVVLCFASATSVVKHSQGDFAGIPKGFLTLLEAMMKMYDGSHYEMYEGDPMVLISVLGFIVMVSIFLANMLVAQLTCAYEAVYEDILGYARLERVEMTVVTMPQISKKRWARFRDNLAFDQKVEFLAGDVGVSGAIQIMEPANQNPTTEDMIKRFGGSTSIEMQWPAEQEGEGDENDRFDRMEVLIQKTMKRITKGEEGKGKGSGAGSSGGGKSGSSGGGNSEGGDED
jgi:uncharacterized membrane protein YgcG